MLKRRLLLVLSLAVLCLTTAPASATTFTLNKDAALLLTMQDAYSGSSSYIAGLDSLSPYTDPATYNPPPPGFMQGVVGFVGYLDPDMTGDVFGWMEIGGGSDTDDVIQAALALGSPSNNLSSYDTYELFVGNDNDDYWGAMLYMATSDGSTTTTYYSNGNTSISNYTEFTAITQHTNTILTWDISGVSNLDNVVDLGFVVGAKHINSIDSDYPSLGDAFHMSVVPVPAAVILGILGLGVVGIKLRKYA